MAIRKNVCIQYPTGGMVKRQGKEYPETKLLTVGSAFVDEELTGSSAQSPPERGTEDSSFSILWRGTRTMSNAPVRRGERSEMSRCVKCHRPIGAAMPKVVIAQFEFHSNYYAAHLRCLEITLKKPDTHPDGNAIQIERYGIRYWAVWDAGTLVCVCLYKKGAREVKRRLEARVPREDDPSSPQRVASRPSASGG